MVGKLINFTKRVALTQGGFPTKRAKSRFGTPIKLAKDRQLLTTSIFILGMLLCVNLFLGIQRKKIMKNIFKLT